MLIVSFIITTMVSHAIEKKRKWFQVFFKNVAASEFCIFIVIFT